MRLLLIGYDLNKPLQNYASLIVAIKTYGSWWHHLDSTWLVRTTTSAEDARKALRAHIDDSDELLVIDVTGDAFAWAGFSAEAGKWIVQNYK